MDIMVCGTGGLNPAIREFMINSLMKREESIQITEIPGHDIEELIQLGKDYGFNVVRIDEGNVSFILSSELLFTGKPHTQMISENSLIIRPEDFNLKQTKPIKHKEKPWLIKKSKRDIYKKSSSRNKK